MPTHCPITNALISTIELYQHRLDTIPFSSVLPLDDKQNTQSGSVTALQTPQNTIGALISEQTYEEAEKNLIAFSGVPIAP